MQETFLSVGQDREADRTINLQVYDCTFTSRYTSWNLPLYIRQQVSLGIFVAKPPATPMVYVLIDIEFPLNVWVYWCAVDCTVR